MTANWPPECGAGKWVVWVASGRHILRGIAEKYVRVGDSVVERLPRQPRGVDAS